MSIIRLGLASALVVVLAGCGGGGLGGIIGGTGALQCNTGTQVQLASPQPYQSGVNTNIGQVVIVANGNSNQLYSTYSAWDVTLTNQFNGQMITGSNLTLVNGQSLVHPYGSDFYYASSNFGQLPAGVTWQVQLNQQNANCLPVPLGTFST